MNRIQAALALAVAAVWMSACGGRVEEATDTNSPGGHSGASGHGGATGVGGQPVGYGGAGGGGSGSGGSSIAGSAGAGWGGWGGSPMCEPVEPPTQCEYCAASQCCDEFVLCDENPICWSIMKCAAECWAAPDSGSEKYADCIDQCAGAVGYPPEISLISDWYDCLCVQTCKGPCEQVGACP